jgi:hypothetical protein
MTFPRSPHHTAHASRSPEARSCMCDAGRDPAAATAPSFAQDPDAALCPPSDEPCKRGPSTRSTVPLCGGTSGLRGRSGDALIPRPISPPLRHPPIVASDATSGRDPEGLCPTLNAAGWGTVCRCCRVGPRPTDPPTVDGLYSPSGPASRISGQPPPRSRNYHDCSVGPPPFFGSHMESRRPGPVTPL